MKLTDVVCNVDDMTTVNGTWAVSFYVSGDSDNDAGYDSAEFTEKTEAVAFAELTKRLAVKWQDDITIIIDGNG
jgi:hypothetical protein